MWNLERRQFLKLAAATVAAEALHGCIPTENAYYRAGYELGLSQKTPIRFMLRQFIREFPQYLEVVRDDEKAFELKLSTESKFADPETLRILGNTITGGRDLARTLYAWSPNNYHKLLGIADGAFGPYMRDFLFMVQCLEITMPGLSYMDPGLCSAVTLRSSATTFGEPVIAKNFDLLNVTWHGCIARKTLPDGQLPSIDNTLNVLPGAISTLNPYVCVTHNTLPGAYMNDKYLPGTCTEQDLMEVCTSVDEAIAFLRGTPNGGYFLFSLADADDNIALVESTPYGKEVVIPDRDYLVVTNHSQCPHPNAPDGAVRTDIEPDTFIRHGRLTHLIEDALANGGKISLDVLKNFMSDHENGGGLESICRHTHIAGTVSSVIMLPRSGRMFVASGHPCEVPWVEYQLEATLS